MIKEYLVYRKTRVSGKLKEKQEQYEHNQIYIVEADNKINELKNMIDEASEIFSVKAREDSGFKNKEIRDLETKIGIYVSQNQDIDREVQRLKKELKTIEECLKEIDLVNVSRETYAKPNYCEEDVSRETCETDNKIQLDLKGYKEICSKLEFVKQLLGVDNYRANIEIDSLINQIK